jgi:pimeloyl-ACP methyl ester carboxylesterase/DNA-binding CsgD family transcriptional regulator
MFRQTVQFTKTPDNVKLAYALSGSGPMLVKCGNWLSHLDFDWESPVWKHWFEFLSSNFTLLRYDERGCGLSDWNLPETGFDKWVDDLNTIVQANELEKFPLLGISRGAAVAIEYAHRYPEKVSHLVLYGGFARGRTKSTSRENKKQDLLMTVMETGWEDQNPAFRQLFASLFVPSGSKEHQQWFAELCSKTASTKNALRIQQIASEIEISEKLSELNVPTLVIHAKDDAVVPLGAGRYLASEIPKAQFVQIESENHLLLPDEPAWEVFCDEVLRFLKKDEPDLSKDLLKLNTLTVKEQSILDLLGEGLSNAGIAEKVFLSEKTIRNHLTNIYDKLGVSSRTEAIVRLRSNLGISS